MMPNRICIGLFETRYLEISPLDAVPIAPVFQYVSGLMLFKHWDLHLAAPAVKELDHV
jgi:hypothetical protein